jgi:hypothetical protein
LILACPEIDAAFAQPLRNFRIALNRLRLVIAVCVHSGHAETARKARDCDTRAPMQHMQSAAPGLERRLELANAFPDESRAPIST